VTIDVDPLEGAIRHRPRYSMGGPARCEPGAAHDRFGFAVILITGLVASQPAAAASQDDRDRRFAAAMQQGDRAVELRQFEDALEAYKRARSASA
jgi:hypothetical protein